ncbi:MAG TPA: MHYT domain-containing protein [Rugosimonospora sp.]|nr:MHYT domain-containing protein [Rugosimonospora sp.]
MATLHQFTYGLVTPVLAYGLSFLGSLLGLIATGRARDSAPGGARARWLVLAAWAIGGTGIWVMHFMAMLGFSVNGSAIRYDIQTTIASWLIAVIVVGVGLFVVGYGRPSVTKVLVGGALTGSGVAAMHYSGMEGMRMDATVGYSGPMVAASVVIAVVASTVALWFTLVVRKAAMVVPAAALMGVAVCGMHYTGMYAMRVHLHDSAVQLQGVDPMMFLVPIMIFVILVAVALAYAMLAAPSKRDRDFQQDLHDRISDRPATKAIPATSAFIPLRERRQR